LLTDAESGTTTQAESLEGMKCIRDAARTCGCDFKTAEKKSPWRFSSWHQFSKYSNRG
jgi:hypothetical protein